MTTPSGSSDVSVKSNSKRLNGKILWFVYDHIKRRGRCGHYAGRIKKVEIVKRVTKRTRHLKVGDIRSITIALSDPYKMTYTGQRIKLRPNEWQKPSCGIFFNNQFTPPEELLT